MLQYHSSLPHRSTLVRDCDMAFNDVHKRFQWAATLYGGTMLHAIPSTDPLAPLGPWGPPERALVREDGRPLRVLVVEDEQLVALDLASIIEQHGGAALDTAATADAALRLATLHRPDLVIMDVRLAPGDGVAAARAIRAATRSALVFVTGNTDPMTMQRIADVGSWPVLRKPVAVPELCAAIWRAYRQDQQGS
jgi:response regulator NasT